MDFLSWELLILCTSIFEKDKTAKIMTSTLQEQFMSLYVSRKLSIVTRTRHESELIWAKGRQTLEGLCCPRINLGHTFNKTVWMRAKSLSGINMEKLKFLPIGEPRMIWPKRVIL